MMLQLHPQDKFILFFIYRYMFIIQYESQSVSPYYDPYFL